VIDARFTTDSQLLHYCGLNLCCVLAFVLVWNSCADIKIVA